MSMTFKPCAIIPSRNHHRATGAIVRALRSSGLAVFIVDDGSAEPARSALERLHAPDEGIVVHRLNIGRGKGGAVIEGFGLADAAGFTHAVQVDADGQHDLSALGNLLAKAQANPESLIVGSPEFDNSMPAGRRMGRWITHFWVCIELRSLRVVDTMCGFRVYPLSHTLALLRDECVGLGMEFDTEILVRLAWRAVRPLLVPVRVSYPTENTSNFDLIWDNWRITKMHTRLILTMLVQLLPRLPKRRDGARQSDHWSEISECGMYWGLRFSAAVYRLAGLRTCLAALLPVILYFYVTKVQQRVASRLFLSRAFIAQGRNAEPNWRDVFRHFQNFARNAVETFGAWVDGGQSKHVEISNSGEIERLAASCQGIILIVSHFGNAELSRAMLEREQRSRIAFLVHTRHAENYNRILRRFCADAAVNAIQVDEIGPESIIALKGLVERGHWVAIAGDRTPVRAGHRVSRVRFLGHDAPFPQGPYVLAHLLECPVYLMFCVRTAGGHRIHFERFSDRIDLPPGDKDKAITVLVERYARRLEASCLLDPFQWYNFYDFWTPAVSFPSYR
jgi:predicted LPLAT superfamily acyltransferase